MAMVRSGFKNERGNFFPHRDLNCAVLLFKSYHNLWNGSHAIPLQRGLVFYQNYTLLNLWSAIPCNVIIACYKSNYNQFTAILKLVMFLTCSWRGSSVWPLQEWKRPVPRLRHHANGLQPTSQGGNQDHGQVPMEKSQDVCQGVHKQLRSKFRIIQNPDTF